MNILIMLSVVLSFLITLIVLPVWIKKSRLMGFLWEDMNKPLKNGKRKKVVSSGGVIVVLSFALSVLYYIAIKRATLKMRGSLY